MIRLVEGLGVEGDAHRARPCSTAPGCGATRPQPNLRQVHLIQAELFDEVLGAGSPGLAGDLGENVTTAGIDLLALPTGTVLLLGDTAAVVVTGLRNPCRQIDGFQPGLLSRSSRRPPDGAGRAPGRRHGRRPYRGRGPARGPGDHRAPGRPAPSRSKPV